MPTTEIIIKFAIVFFLTLLFGIERQKSHKPIGFGTFIFVAAGSCGLSIAAIRLSPDNPLPLLSGIVTSIGFLGAGALIRTTDKIFGFTTAAGIWTFAIFGMLIGIGEILIGLIVYILIWAVILIDRYLEIRGIGSYRRKLTIRTKGIIPEKDLKNMMLTSLSGHKLLSLEIDKSSKSMTLAFLIESRKSELNKLPNTLYKLDWVDFCKVE